MSAILLMQWSLGNYSESIKRLFEPSLLSSNYSAGRKRCHVSFEDPHIGRYCLILASKHCLKNAIGDYLASVVSKFATMLDVYSLQRFGLPVSAFQFNLNFCSNCTLTSLTAKPFSVSASSLSNIHYGCLESYVLEA